MSSFFTTPASQRKRKRLDATSGTASKKRSSARNPIARSINPQNSSKARDESISGSESEADVSEPIASDDGSYDSEDSNPNETAAERRLKLAERYLEDIRAEVADGQEIGFDAEDVDRELIAARLKEDVAEEKGRIYRLIADQLDFEDASHTFFRADTGPTTGVSACAPYVYTVSKDMALVKWETVREGAVRRKPKQVGYTKGNKKFANDPSYKHHSDSILCVSASPDGKFVVTGGADRRLIIWDGPTLQPLKVFTQHRDAITAIALRGKTNQLFSASKDRTIKIWSVNDLAYVETLFGHQDEVSDIAAVGGNQERCVSVGARDRSARLWKVVEESQLVFRGGGLSKPLRSRDDQAEQTHSRLGESSGDVPIRYSEGSLDRIIQLDTQIFVTGSDSGALSLYALYKKKPLHTIYLAHGVDEPPQLDKASAELNPKARNELQPTPRWITALACVPFSDLFISGSWDGCIRAWKISTDMKKIEPVGVINSATGTDGGVGANKASTTVIRGVVNDLAVYEKGERGKDGLCVVAAVGTECRLGRWMKFEGRNGAMMFNVPRSAMGLVNGGPHGGE